MNFPMRFWWVNQNQTHRQEISGGYIWSPKRNANGARNPFYETMREVSPGDVVFSFVDTRIAAIGIAQSYCWESPKPQEFGTTGDYWENIGWKVRVAFTPLLHKVRPKDHIEILKPLLPDKYSPLQASGNGLQGIYLAEVSQPLAEVLAGLIGAEASIVTAGAALPALAPDAPVTHPEVGDDLDYWEHKLEQKVVSDTTLPKTTREAIIRARVGQGKFKENVRQIEQRCRITGVDQVTHLVASHIRPWRDSMSRAE